MNQIYTLNKLLGLKEDLNQKVNSMKNSYISLNDIINRSLLITITCSCPKNFLKEMS